MSAQQWSLLVRRLSERHVAAASTNVTMHHLLTRVPDRPVQSDAPPRLPAVDDTEEGRPGIRLILSRHGAYPRCLHVIAQVIVGFEILRVC